MLFAYFSIIVSSYSTNEVLVHWQPPPEEHHNGPLIGYRLQFKQRARGGRPQSRDLGVTPTKYTVSGLLPGTQYIVRVRVCFSCTGILHRASHLGREQQWLFTVD